MRDRLINHLRAHPGRWAAIAAIVLAGLALRLRGFAPFDISHADELMQYLEQAKRLATGHGIVPWEYRYGIRSALIAQGLALPWWLGSQLAPGSDAALLLARGSFMALTLLALPGAWLLGRRTSPAAAIAALFMAAVWWESVVFSNLLLSESLGAALILPGAALLLDPARRRGALVAAGLLIALGVVVRLQYAPFAAVLALLVLRRDWRGWGAVLGGVAVAAGIAALSDLAMGRWPFAWVWFNFAFNIAEGRAEKFGVSGPFEYVGQILFHLGPIAPLILLLAALAPARYRPLLAAAVANVAFHSLIAHKEYRFVWLSVLTVLVLAAIASVTLTERLLAARGRRLPGWGLALLCLGWLGLSLSAAQQTGGARALRGGAPIPLAARDGAALPGTCGIALPNEWRGHLVTALLPREVPLYVGADGALARGEPLPAGVVASANVLVYPALPGGADGYRQVSCRSNGVLRACTFVRAGGCRPDPLHTYQAMLRRHDL